MPRQLSFSGLTPIEYLQNLWDYSEHMDELLDVFLINIGEMAKVWPKNFPNVNFIVKNIRKRNEFFNPGTPGDEDRYFNKLVNLKKKENIFEIYF